MKDLAWSRLADLRTAALTVLGGRPAEPATAGPAQPAAQALLPTVRDLASSITEDLAVDPFDAARTHTKAIEDVFSDYRTALAAVVSDTGGSMWNDFMAQATTWGESYRRTLLSRFIGFPLWDALIFPTVALSQLPQFTTIAVDQFSPREASTLTPAVATTDLPGKLAGVSMGHFGAFADPKYRENDYLWGRLDAVELILRMLDEAATSPTSPDAPALLRKGFVRVLDSEKSLGRTADLQQRLRTFIASLT
jgi:hypothetical protein